jgi:hypothetical protein
VVDRLARRVLPLFGCDDHLPQMPLDLWTPGSLSVRLVGGGMGCYQFRAHLNEVFQRNRSFPWNAGTTSPIYFETWQQKLIDGGV